MRIALVSQEYPPETAKGGLGTQTRTKARGLAALGHDVQVISRTARETPGQRSSAESEGVHVTRIPGFESRMPVYADAVDWLTYSGEVAAEIARLHRAVPLDLVEFAEWGGEGYVHLMNRTEWNQVPAIVHLHGPIVMFAHAMGWPELASDLYRVGVAMESTCVRLADAVYSSSACSANWCAKHYGGNREAMPILHAGIEIDRFRPQSRVKSDRPTVVFAGKLVPNKGILELVEAAGRLLTEFPRLRLVLIGRADENMQSRLRACAERAGGAELLEFAGFVDHDSLPELLARADVFALPSHYEPGPGLVYLEAMACGLPVIGCEGAGAAEIIRHGDNGLLVPPRDPEALCAALRLLLSDDANREAMGAAARRFVVREADCRVCVKKIEEFYRSVLDSLTGREAFTDAVHSPPQKAADRTSPQSASTSASGREALRSS